MFTDCHFANVHPDDDGPLAAWSLMKLPDIGGMIKNKIMKLMGGAKFEPWRGWPVREEEAMEFDPNGGLPDDSEREITKICCSKPMRKCITIGEPTVVVRALPAPVFTSLLHADQGHAVQRCRCAPTRRRLGCGGRREAQEFL
ncbi:unnamed protein product [Symbiodinium natans]|uniref:Uncharacterized protein n=1 Tax=Symbiodinium natans TaxID=878477 RepID=A0A812GLM0_9DINO|nr:unnamed protein product [Symbiodinium natans]